ncbi:hypothetical protein [Bdellovibrio sp. HCB209]|uniref:hypothetical protein n=1 Tax=Bdellovibrio sp. HCB209 TaxID=3394354 RepID=UPI0039B69F7F
MKKWIPVVLLSICSLQKPASAAPGKKITDTVVKNLSCENLTVDSIYKSITPAAFHTYYHIPATNWKFTSGGLELGACWGLSSAQRRMFYLARFEEKEDLSKADLLRKTLDMFRGAELTEQQSGRGGARMVSTPLNQLEVIRYSDQSLLHSWAREDVKPDGLFPLLNRGYKENLKGQTVWKTLKLDLQRSQQQHFFRGGNVAMITGESQARNQVDNLLTMTKLEKNLKGNRLTLLNLRWGLTSQHVVVAKEVYDQGAYFIIFVYDSNAPLITNIVHFDKKKKTFYAPGIGVNVVPDTPDREIGVFIVDEEERAPIEAAMLRYYRAECNK